MKVRFLCLLPILALTGLLMTSTHVSAAPEGSGRIQIVKTPGGLTAWLVEEYAIPMIAMEASFTGGGSLDPKDRPGLANMTSWLMNEGAGDMDARAFMIRLDELAVKMSFSSERDTFSVSMRTLLDNHDESFDLLRLALSEPRFDADAVERARADILSTLKQNAVDPNSRAREAWFSTVFPGDPYGQVNEGTKESIGLVSREDIAAHYPVMIDRKHLTIGVVGAISAKELVPLLDATFGALPEGTAKLPVSIEPKIEGGVEVLEEDVPQSVVLFGHQGPLRDDEDFIPAYVMNYILGGGGFSSRLMEEVREKRGLAYSVYSYLAPLDRAGLYLGGVATSNERVAESLQIIRQEWARIAEEGVSEEDLEAAKKYLTGAYALRFDSNSKIAGILVGMQRHDLPPSYIDERNDLVNAVTTEDIRRVARQFLHADQLFSVVVGKPEGL